MPLAYHYALVCVGYGSYVCDNSSICWPPLLDLGEKKKRSSKKNKIKNVTECPEKKVPFDAVVGSAEVKQMNHDAEVCSCDSRFWAMSNVSQLSKV